MDPTSVKVPYRRLPRDGTDIIFGICVALPFGLFPLFIAPVLLCFLSACALGMQPDTAFLCAFSLYILICLIALPFMVVSLRLSARGLRFVRLAGKPKFLRWDEITEIVEVTRQEVIDRAWAVPRFPSREMTPSLSALRHFRITWGDQFCYYPPADPEGFVRLVAEFRAKHAEARAAGETGDAQVEGGEAAGSTVMTRRRKWVRKGAIALAAVVVILLCPLPVRDADVSRAVEDAVVALQTGRSVFLNCASGTWQDRLIRRSPFSSGTLVQGKALYYFNDTAVDNAVFTRHGIQEASGAQSPRFYIEPGRALIVVTTRDRSDDVSTGALHFCYYYGDLGARGYRVRVYRSLLGVVGVFTREWAA